MIKTTATSSQLDNWGIFISTLCAIHCVLTPLLLISSAHLSTQVESLHSLELPLFAVAFGIAAIALYSSYKRHKSFQPLLLVVSGFILVLLAGGLATVFETLFRVIGSLLIISGHVQNSKLTHSRKYAS